MNILNAFNEDKKFKLILIRNPEFKCFFDCERNQVSIEKLYDRESFLSKDESTFLRFLIDVSMGVQNSVAYKTIILSDNFDQELQAETVKFAQKPFYLSYSPDKKVKFLESAYVRFLYAK